MKYLLTFAAAAVVAVSVLAFTLAQAPPAPSGVTVANTADGVRVSWSADDAAIHRVGWAHLDEVAAAQAAGDWQEAFHFADSKAGSSYTIRFLPDGVKYLVIVGTASMRFAPAAWGEWNSITVDYGTSGTPVAPGTGASNSDRDALVALYNATDGPNWHDNTNWLSNAPIGEWDGVTTDDSGRVSKLFLGGNRLSGTIPPELGSLSNLETLRLTGNRLSGAIPSELGNLASLRLLSLGSNQLTGAIPSELGSLSNLQGLYLYNNLLVDEIPSELGSLSRLEVLDLNYNRLSGAIPSELGNLSSLEMLKLYGNRLVDKIPPELGNLSNLEVLDLDYNYLGGRYRPSWATFLTW